MNAMERDLPNLDNPVLMRVRAKLTERIEQMACQAAKEGITMNIFYDSKQAVWRFVVKRPGLSRVAGCALSFQDAKRCALAVAFTQEHGKKRKGA